jgi:hypothetical protein
MIDVSAAFDTPTYQSFDVGTTASSQMWIRVEDTNNSQGGTSLDDLFVDHMFIETQGSVPPAPAPITDLSATPVANEITLSWTNGGDESGTKIQRKKESGPFSEIASLGPGADGYLDTDLEYATEYSYQVGPFTAGGTTWSTDEVATTLDPPAGQALHVVGIAGTGTDKKRWTATATPEILNQLNSGESGVLVSGLWGGEATGTDTCTTDTFGKCSMSIPTRGASVDFTVTNVQKSGFSYTDTDPTVTIVKGQSAAPAAKSGLELPAVLSLNQNYPNPFNPVTIIEYGVPETQHVTVSVYNALGIEVGRLFDGSQEAGWHRVAFDGSGLSSGLYVAVLRGAGEVRSRTMLLSK